MTNQEWKLCVTLDGKFISYETDLQALIAAFGQGSTYEPLEYGWIIRHPLNPYKPLLAEWVIIDN